MIYFWCLTNSAILNIHIPPNQQPIRAMQAKVKNNFFWEGWYKWCYPSSQLTDKTDFNEVKIRVHNLQTRRTSMKSNFPVFCSRIPSIAVVMKWNRISPEAPALNVGNCIVASSLRNVTILVNKSVSSHNHSIWTQRKPEILQHNIIYKECTCRYYVYQYFNEKASTTTEFNWLIVLSTIFQTVYIS